MTAIKPIPDATSNEPRRLGPPVDPAKPQREIFCPRPGEKTCHVVPCEDCGVNIFLVFNIHTGNKRPVDIQSSALLRSEDAIPNSVFLLGVGKYAVSETFTRALKEEETGRGLFRYYHQPHQATCKPKQREKPKWTPFNPVIKPNSNVVAFPVPSRPSGRSAK